MPREEITYLASERRFVLLANRFCWETKPEAPPPPLEEGADASFEQASADLEDRASEDGKLYSRVICGLCFDRVRAVHSRNMARNKAGQPLNLLSVQRGLAAWSLRFADDIEIRLEGTAIVAHLEDLGEAWPTRWRPSHEAPGGGVGQA